MTLLGDCQRRGAIIDFPILKSEHASNAQRSLTYCKRKLDDHFSFPDKTGGLFE